MGTSVLKSSKYNPLRSRAVVSTAPIRILLVLTAASLLVACMGGEERQDAATAAVAESTPPEAPPGELRNAVFYITDKDGIRQEVYAQTCFLYERLNIAKLSRIHVDFFDPKTQSKDTLDAPEGFLYLADFEKNDKGDSRIAPGHPFYEALGGPTGNVDLLTTFPRYAGVLPDQITRHRNDLDLIGRVTRKIVYRRADGTSVSCLRAYHDAKRALYHGIGRCELRRKVNNQVQVMYGETFTTEGEMKEFVIRGKGSTVRSE